MFRTIILPIFRSTRLCVTICGIMHPRCCRPPATSVWHSIGFGHWPNCSFRWRFDKRRGTRRWLFVQYWSFLWRPQCRRVDTMCEIFQMGAHTVCLYGGRFCLWALSEINTVLFFLSIWNFLNSATILCAFWVNYSPPQIRKTYGPNLGRKSF